MNLVAVLVVLAVVGVVAAVVTGSVRGELAEPADSLAPSGLPEGDLGAEDVRAVRFSLGLRGYRMDEVDAVLERLTDELDRRDAELEDLRGRLQGVAPLDRNGTAESQPGGRHLAEDRLPDRPVAAPRRPGRHEAPREAPGGPASDRHPEAASTAQLESGTGDAEAALGAHGERVPGVASVPGWSGRGTSVPGSSGRGTSVPGWSARGTSGPESG